MTQPDGLRWIEASKSDLAAAQSLLTNGYYHLCAFHSQQTAEKALKGLLRLFRQIPWGHSCLNLIKQVQPLIQPGSFSEDLITAVQRLDGHYTPARYPDAFPAGTPAEHYSEPIAKQAYDDAKSILDFVLRNMP